MLQLNQTTHVVGQVLKPDACFGADDPNTAHQRSAHVVALGPEDMFDPDANRGADVLSVRVGKAGGLSAARSILDAAHGAGMPCILGSMLETDLGITAALQLAASVECALHACALSHYAMYDASFLEQPLRQDGGTLYVPTGPGLGVTVSEQRIDQFRESP